MFLDKAPIWKPFYSLLRNKRYATSNFPVLYRWTSRRREQLFADIRAVGSESGLKEPYMGTVITYRSGLRPSGLDDVADLDILEGVEPLATLFVLLKEVIATLDEDDRIRKIVSAEARQAFPDPIVLDEQSQKHLDLAQREGAAFGKEWGREQTAHEMFGIVKNRLLFIYLEVGAKEQGRQIFEALPLTG